MKMQWFVATALALGMMSIGDDAFGDLVGPGDIAFVGFNADGDDDFAFVTLVDIAANSTVYFRDDEWDGSSFSTGEGTITWDSGASVIDAGTVITFSDTSSSGTLSLSHGTATGSVALASSNEALWAYLGSDADTPTAFLSVVANEVDGAPTNAPDLTNTGLTDGINAQIIDGDEDVMVYTGLRTNLSSFAAYAAQISNDANWTTADGGGDQSGGFLPFNTTPFETANVPEPTSLAMVGCGMLGMMFVRRKRRVRSSIARSC